MMNERSQALLSAQWVGPRASYPAPGSARETAYRILRDRIIFLDLKPGEALNDKRLSEELQMSRTPVREALIILSVSNMVILKPQAGTFVAPIDTQWVEMEQFSRRALEKEIIRQACAGMTAELARLYAENLAAYARQRQTQSPDRMARLLELDNDFHRIAFLAAGRENSFYHMLRDMQHIERLRMLSMLTEDSGALIEDHREISRAVIEGDETEAIRHLERHLTRYRESLLRARERFPEYFTIG